MTEADVRQGRINDQLGTQLESISAQVEAKVEQGRNKMSEWKSTVQDKSKETFNTVNDFTQNKPWQALGVAVLAGWVLGMLMGRD